MYDITSIKNYILYLKKECSLAITLHIRGIDNVVVPSELISFNIHDNPYCIYVKTCKEAQNHCIERQWKIHNKCKDGSFQGVCYAGVKEYIYPIKHNERVLGFISVSGYKCENANEYINSVSNKYALSKEGLVSNYKSLKDRVPSKQTLDTLITPLCNMLELAYIKSDNNVSQRFSDKIVWYIKKNHTSNISSEDICKEFSCSRSKMSRSFNKDIKMSLKEYINHLRIEDAKALLSYSDLTITEIAYSVGFSDSNYFTEVFKKLTGMTPSAYAKQSTAKS